ncbi:hypothetical protein BDP81DRAFT_416393 [Colletotrichum phormii]|uniref:Uncharacterized protein n=1 Tax=Colletotrichum phormii TaxID=359342 RepID=A0AAJ0EMR9_9PEZI|nr:uncharacterized protein BDP81DRAFT_416393 [Colletotrichum phormii]KAK1654738.1 hypothetical protein BDP81DRAFT_416393 [Colletotrichum phormii]
MRSSTACASLSFSVACCSKPRLVCSDNSRTCNCKDLIKRLCFSFSAALSSPELDWLPVLG